MIYPKLIKENGVIGITALSSGTGDDLGEVKIALNHLKEHGYKLIVTPLTKLIVKITGKKNTNGKLFVAIFGVCSIYFSCVMVRLLLLSSPALCLLSGIGISELIHFFVDQMKNYNEDDDKQDTY